MGSSRLAAGARTRTFPVTRSLFVLKGAPRASTRAAFGGRGLTELRNASAPHKKNEVNAVKISTYKDLYIAELQELANVEYQLGEFLSEMAE
jgi:hypothetical protein